MEATKRRIPVVAALLSIFVPGLGQMYNGKFQRGALLWCGQSLLLIVLGLTELVFSFYGWLVMLGSEILVGIFIVVDAAIGARRANMLQLKWYNRWWLYVGIPVCAGLILDLVVVEFARSPVARVKAFRIPSSAMIPTLEPGDHILAKLEPYGDRLPARGDIIIFPYPEDTSKDFIKRVIGLPGEELEIRDKAVFINGQRLDDPWSVHLDPATIPRSALPRDNMEPITIPPGSVFVLGDNRDFSHDSRFWGFVQLKDIEARALFIYYSKDRSRIGKQIK